MPLYPNEAILNLTERHMEGDAYGTMRSSIESPRWKSPNAVYPSGGTQYIIVQKGGFLFHCCGASSLSSLSHRCESEQDQQNFAYMLWQAIETGQTYYFIADTGQLKNNTQLAFGNTVGILLSLGAKEVDASKNRNHGPNHMHLHVWAPTRNSNEWWRKYLHFGSNGTAVPLWWYALKEEEQVKLIANSKEKQDLIAAFAKEKRDAAMAQKAQANKFSAQHLIDRGELNDYLKARGWVKPDRVPDLGSSQTTVSNVGWPL